jgi:hypothetical protein
MTARLQDLGDLEDFADFADKKTPNLPTGRQARNTQRRIMKN